jgi:hypothetical protein
MEVQGKFKMQAHIISGVVIDIAAFEVSHSVGCAKDAVDIDAASDDIDAAALRAARARSKSIGAMDESSGQVQDANTHNQRCCHGCCSLQS